MDPGRLLHAFVCRGSTNLDEGQILLLPPRSPAESLLCWLEGLPGTSHKIVRWQDLDTEYFEKKIGKSLRKKIGQFPLPSQYAVRNLEAASRASVPVSSSSPALLEHPNTVSPPPYSASTAELQDQSQPAAELGSPDARELPASSPARSPTERPQHATSLPVPGASSSSGLKSIHTLRRTISAQATGMSPAAPASTASSKADASTVERRQELPASSPAVVELHEETMPPKPPPKPTEPTSPLAVELPTDFQSEAPKALAPKGIVPASSEDPKVCQVEGNIDEIQVVEEPEELEKTDVTKVEQKDSQEMGPSAESFDSPKQRETSNQYLKLLNRVARGEISPQVLGEMLQKNDIGARNPEANEETTLEDVKALDAAESTSKSPEPASGSLPYPLSVAERKDLDWKERTKSEKSAPYPVSPTEKDANPEPILESIESEVPTSLKLGAPSQDDSHYEIH